MVSCASLLPRLTSNHSGLSRSHQGLRVGVGWSSYLGVGSTKEKRR